MSMTRVYRYGLLPPTQGHERIWDQLRLAHRYQQRLVEIERTRRTAVAALEAEDATVAQAHAALTAAEAEVARWLAVPLVGRRRAPDAAAALPTARLAVREARAILRVARAAARAARAPALATINQEASDEIRAARKTSGLYWGTYLQIEQAMDLARRSPTPPRFPAWRGEGRLAVQIQHGLSPEALANDRRLQIDTAPQPVPGRGGKSRPRVRLRIGTEDEGRDPIWGEWPVILHRPIPPEARIMWAQVVLRRTAGRAEWSLHLTLDLPDTWQTEAGGQGTVAVDLGWRRESETRRAGGWTDGTASGDILVEPEVIGALERSESLRGIRDRALPAIREVIRAWRDAQDVLPAEHADRLARVGMWQSSRRFGGLTLWWRTHRTEGDANVVAALEDWYRQDAHLWRWEAHGRQTALARRRDQYRRIAADLARRYHTLVVERLDLRAMAQRHVAPGEQVANAQRHETAASELRAALVHAFRSRGGEVVSVAPDGPAATLLAAYHERRDVVEMPGAAREARFARIARESAERRAQTAATDVPDDGPLA